VTSIAVASIVIVPISMRSARGPDSPRPRRACARIRASEHAIGLLGARGHHDDRHVGACAQLAADLDAVGAREHQVEQHDIGVHALNLGHRLIAPRDQRDVDPVRVQVLRGESRQALVVLDVDHADLGIGRHRSSIPLKARRAAPRNIPKYAVHSPRETCPRGPAGGRCHHRARRRHRDRRWLAARGRARRRGDGR
jgi:hypothetical protein